MKAGNYANHPYKNQSAYQWVNKKLTGLVLCMSELDIDVINVCYILLMGNVRKILFFVRNKTFCSTELYTY